METLPRELPAIPYARERVRSSDGVVLAVQHVGDGPTVLLANGIGLTEPVLDFLVDHLRTRYRVVLWDYRGAGRSRLERDGAELSMARHATDGLEVLDGLGESRAVVLGWSMGVPVGLEMIRSAPERVAGLGALFGSPGPPFRAAFPDPLAATAERSFAITERVPWPTLLAVQVGSTIPPLAWAFCASIRFVGLRAHRELFHRCVQSVREADRQAYFRTLNHLLEHDARDVLPLVRCPVLVVTGSNDWVTPPDAAEEMAKQTPGARLLVLPHTSHFGPIEHGPALWRAIDELLTQAYPGG
jgi:pimeloyl-ACP methyl ester carboxylesterase